jgi:hypothetical protein
VTRRLADLGHLVRPPATFSPWEPPRQPGMELDLLRKKSPWVTKPGDVAIVMPDYESLRRFRDALRRL